MFLKTRCQLKRLKKNSRSSIIALPQKNPTNLNLCQISSSGPLKISITWTSLKAFASVVLVQKSKSAQWLYAMTKWFPPATAERRVAQKARTSMVFACAANLAYLLATATKSAALYTLSKTQLLMLPAPAPRSLAAICIFTAKSTDRPKNLSTHSPALYAKK